MNAKWLIGLVLAAGIAVAAWFFVSPLFIDRVVDEPPLAAGSLPSAQQVRAMPAAEREALMDELMAEAARSDTEVSEGMETIAGPVQVATGTFSDADAIHKGTGRAAVYKLEDGSHVLRFDDFRVTNGPALVVLLATVRDPQSAAEVERGYIKLAPLKGNVGSQNYPLPANLDVYSFGSVVIWCDLFDVLFSAAPLKLL